MKTTLDLGADVVQRLLPHRRPMLMVDRLEGFDAGPPSALWASRFISSNEPVFEGHFPNLHLWPGVFTIEGLLQTCNVLHIIYLARAEVQGAGGNPDEVLEALQNLELAFRMNPGYRPELTKKYEALLGAGSDPISRGGMAAAVDIKLLAPVFAGTKLDYRGVISRELDQMIRFEVEASVSGRTVAKGVVTSSRGLMRMPAAS